MFKKQEDGSFVATSDIIYSTNSVVHSESNNCYTFNFDNFEFVALNYDIIKFACVSNNTNTVFDEANFIP